MNFRHAISACAFSIAVAFAAAPASSAEVVFTAALRGDAAPTNTDSTAKGDATITVDTDTQTVDVALKVTGISFADFYDHLAHAPVGPMHLHHYAADGNVTLLMPFPMGPSYAETKEGFTLTVKDYPYAEGAKILESNVTFDGFLAAMKSGEVVLNIHTNKYHDGEISGLVKVAK